MAQVTGVPFLPMLPRLMANLDLADVMPAWAHPTLRYWAPTYTQIRDCMLGEQEVRSKGKTYLKPMADMDEEEYARYLDSAVFFNMVGRTVNALVGTVFQRDPKVKNIPASLAGEPFKKITYNGVTFTSFLTLVVEGIISMGRYGVHLDRDSTGGTPYLRGYESENIIDWTRAWVNGRYVLTQVVLREFVEINTRTIGEIRKYKIIYRVLSLDMGDQYLITTPSNNNATLSEMSFSLGTGGGPLSVGQPESKPGNDMNGFPVGGGAVPAVQASPMYGVDNSKPVYREYIYEVNNINAALNTVTPVVVTPTNRGQTLDFIPIMLFGAKDNSPDLDRPPMADIAKLNLAHYRTYAHLEHGRYYTAMPIYYVQVLPHAEKAEYTLGPSRVWEVAQGEKPGILEFNGQGLKTLEVSLAQKEEQIALLGGRLAGSGTGSRNISESDSQATIKEANERALLLKVINNTEDGMAQLLDWWAWWQDEPNANVTVDIGAELNADRIGARELRAAQMLYETGAIPVTALHAYFLKAELLPEWMDVDQFKSLLGTVEEFPNQPDVWAKQMGYSDAAHRHDVLLQRRDLRNKEDLADIQRTDVVGSLDVDQQTVDVQQQLADQAAEAAAKAHIIAQKQVDAQQKVGMAQAKAAGRPVVPGAAQSVGKPAKTGGK